jgi:hypothetical protein
MDVMDVALHFIYAFNIEVASKADSTALTTPIRLF